MINRVVLVAVLAFFLIGIPVRAEDEAFDFTAGDGGWLVGNLYNPYPTDLHCEHSVDQAHYESDGWYPNGLVYYDLGENQHVTGITISYVDPGSVNNRLQIRAFRDDPGDPGITNPPAPPIFENGGYPQAEMVDLQLPSGTQTDHPVSFAGEPGEESVRWLIFYTCNPSFDNVKVTALTIHTDDLPSLYKPLSQYEIDSAYEIDELQLINNFISVGSYDTIPDPSLTTMAVSRVTGAKIHNAIDGTVTLVREMQLSDCDSFGLNGDKFFIAAGAGPDVALVQNALGWYCTYLFESEITVSFVVATAQSLTQLNVFRDKYYVEVLGDDGLTYYYLAENADAYVQTGDSVAGGCQLGESLTTYFFSVSIGGDPGVETLSEGFAFVKATSGGDAIPIADRMTQEPVNGQPCNATPDHQSCVGDSLMDTPSQWSMQGGTWLPNGGVRLPAGAKVFTNPPLVLDANQNPKLTIQARSTGGSGQLTSSLGETSQAFALSSSLGQYVIDGDTHTANSGDLYIIAHENTGATTIEVTVSCLSFTTLSDGTTPDPEDYDPPPACLFDNQTFNDGTGSWFVTNAEPGDGSIRLTSGGTITQAQELVGDSDDFTISATSALWHYNTYTPDPDNATGGVTIEYQIDGGGWTTIDAEITYGAYAQNNNRIRVSDDFNTSTVSGDFQFRVTLASAPTGVRGVELLDVCINAGTEYDPDEPFPEPDGAGEFPPPPPFSENCQVITAPSGSDVAQWLYWHWSQLDAFFQCDLMRLLNAIYDLIVEFYQLVGWMIRWVFATTQLVWDWMANAFFPWLAGYLSNIAPGTVVVNQDQQCDNLFCAITSFFDVMGGIIDILRQLLDFIFYIAGRILDFIFQLLGVLFDLLGMIQDLFNALISAYVDATPVEIPYLPTCSINPQQNGFCIALWGMEHTIFSGTGALLIPVILAYSGTVWLLWAVREVKKTIFDTSDRL